MVIHTPVCVFDHAFVLLFWQYLLSAPLGTKHVGLADDQSEKIS